MWSAISVSSLVLYEPKKYRKAEYVQRRGHLAECLQEHERDMELSFAVARSKEKTCGICMETVLDKPKGEARC